MMYRLQKAVLGVLLFSSGAGFPAETYLVCGPDEDGCYRDIYHYCNCIPVDDNRGEQPYCLDLDSMRCHPLADRPDCVPALTFKDQASCVSTIFQSSQEPACARKTQAFCRDNGMSFCDEDGHPDSCRPWPKSD